MLKLKRIFEGKKMRVSFKIIIMCVKGFEFFVKKQSKEFVFPVKEWNGKEGRKLKTKKEMS